MKTTGPYQNLLDNIFNEFDDNSKIIVCYSLFSDTTTDAKKPIYTIVSVNSYPTLNGFIIAVK